MKAFFTFTLHYAFQFCIFWSLSLFAADRQTDTDGTFSAEWRPAIPQIRSDANFFIHLISICQRRTIISELCCNGHPWPLDVLPGRRLKGPSMSQRNVRMSIRYKTWRRSFSRSAIKRRRCPQHPALLVAPSLLNSKECPPLTRRSYSLWTPTRQDRHNWHLLSLRLN